MTTKHNSSGGGSITIAPPVTAGNYTLTLPAETGTVALQSQTGAFKNKIINGGFAINQRAYVSGAAVGAGLYGHDRWKMAASGDTYTYSTTNNKTTITIPATKVLQQVIEGLNLQTGTYCLSWEGTAQGKIGAGSYGASGITGSITGGTDTTIEFGPGTVANVQLEAGSVATPFESRPYGTELALCRRYFEASYVYVPSTTDRIPLYYKVSKRVAPTVSGGGAGFASNGVITTEQTYVSQTTGELRTLLFSSEL